MLTYEYPIFNILIRVHVSVKKQRVGQRDCKYGWAYLIVMLLTQTTSSHVHFAQMSVQVVTSLESLIAQLTLVGPHLRMHYHMLRHLRHQIRREIALGARILASRLLITAVVLVMGLRHRLVHDCCCGKNNCNLKENLSACHYDANRGSFDFFKN